MEEETYTRWLFPGVFAVGTFLWLGNSFCTLNSILANWGKILVPLMISVPVIGFVAGILVQLISNGYTGRWFWESKVRKFCKERFQKISSQFPNSFKICNKDPDILFSLVALDVIKEHSMPELLIKHGRRRWTICWASWNSAMGIIFGIIGYIIFYGLFPWRCEVIVPPLCIVASLVCVGLAARLNEEYLELGWFVLTYGTNEERLSNLIQEQLKGDFVKMSRVTIKYNDLIELLKTLKADTVIEEALKVGEIDIVDDVYGEKIGVISLKKDSNKNL